MVWFVYSKSKVYLSIISSNKVTDNLKEELQIDKIERN